MAERLPETPYVVEPRERIGEYGGILRAATLRPTGSGDDTRLSSPGTALKPTADGSELVPEVVEAVEPSEDRKTWMIHMRRGLKWSDGHPMTAADIMFWYEDVLLNEELTPAINDNWKAAGEVMQTEGLDDYTVQFTFSAPKAFFDNWLVHGTRGSMFYPKHYLQQFHKDHVSAEEIEQRMDEEGFGSWYELFLQKASIDYQARRKAPSFRYGDIRRTLV